jgi:LysR family transcriptional regulator, glycine cleavage system transcriptional activator
MERDGLHADVRHGDGSWAGLDVVRLSFEQLFAVCSPKLLGGRHRMSKPSDALKFPLLHLDDRKDWAKWLEAVGVANAELSHGPALNRASMVIDAAVDGQSIALARTTLAAWDLIVWECPSSGPLNFRFSLATGCKAGHSQKHRPPTRTSLE